MGRSFVKGTKKRLGLECFSVTIIRAQQQRLKPGPRGQCCDPAKGPPASALTKFSEMRANQGREQLGREREEERVCASVCVCLCECGTGVCLCPPPGWGGEGMEGRRGEMRRKEEKHRDEKDRGIRLHDLNSNQTSFKACFISASGEPVPPGCSPWQRAAHFRSVMPHYRPAASHALAA